jgi:hypothetical protein
VPKINSSVNFDCSGFEPIRLHKEGKLGFRGLNTFLLNILKTSGILLENLDKM